MSPAAFLQEVACEIVHMEPLHHQNDGILPLVIEARIDRVVEPLLRVHPFRLRHAFGGLQRVVDDDQTAAAPGKGAADRCGEARSAARGHDLGLRILGRIDPGPREGSHVPVAGKNRPELVSKRGGKVLRVARTDDAPPRIVTKQPGRERDRCADRLEAARRHGDDQSLDLTQPHQLQMMRDGIDVPVVQILRRWAHRGEAAADEDTEILTR